MKRKLKAIVIAVCIIMFIYGIPVYAVETEWMDTITVSTETELKNAISNATNSACILLSSEIVLTEDTIEIPEGKKIKIASDTAGVNRKLDGDSRFRVIYNKGELYLENITVTNGNAWGGGVMLAAVYLAFRAASLS